MKPSMTQDENVKLVKQLFEFAQIGQQERRVMWEQNYKIWSATNEVRRPTHKDRVRVPLLFMISDHILATLTDNSPKVIFYPQERNDIPTADALQPIYQDYYWDILELTRKSEELIWWAEVISGSAHFKFGIDRLTEKQYVEVVNSFMCFPDPTAKELKTCEFFDEVSVWSLMDLKRTFPAAEEVRAQNELMTLVEQSSLHTPWGGNRVPSTEVISVFKDTKFKQEYGRVLVHECWVKDTTMEPIPFQEADVMQEYDMIMTQDQAFRDGKMAPEQLQVPEVRPGVAMNHPEHINHHNDLIYRWENDPSVSPVALKMLIAHNNEHQQEPQKTEKLKYPNGKILTVAGDALLDITPAVFGLPYVKYDFISDPTQYWGQALPQYLGTLQENIERGKRQISDSAERTANPKVYYDVMSGYVATDVKHNPGEQIAVRGNPQSAVYVENLPPVQGYVIDNIRESERLLDKIAGVSEVAQGIEPRNDLSGKAMRSLLEQLGPRMRKFARHYEGSLRELFRALFKMLPYEDPTKIYRILGQDSGDVEWKALTDLALDSEYDIRITSGSTMPTSRQQKLSDVLQLVNTQITPNSIVDRREVLESLDYKNAPKILQRMEEKEQMIQLIQEQDQQIQELSKNLEGLGKEYVRSQEKLEKATARKTSDK